MVRTKDSASVKVSGAKAPRKITPASTSAESGSDPKKKYSGGNPYCPRETPAWQKPITSFFSPPTTNSNAGSSSTVVSNDSGDTTKELEITGSDVSENCLQEAESKRDSNEEATVNTKAEDGDNHEPN